jgi:hypothetical protein
MRTTSWGSALLLAVLAHSGAYAGDAGPASSVDTVEYSARDSRTRLEIRTREGARHVVWVGRDSTVAPDAGPTSVDVVGDVGDARGSAVILVDTYPSIPGGMSYCQAGEERFLRVVSIAKARPKETLHLKLASCRDNIELASPGIEWHAAAATLHIHWLLGPARKGQPEDRTIRIAADGTPG